MVIGEVFGCLEIVGDGSNNVQNNSIQRGLIESEKEKFIELVNQGLLEERRYSFWNGEKDIVKSKFVYKPDSFKAKNSVAVNVEDFEEAIQECDAEVKNKGIKCRCKKCGKIRYYSKETLETRPSYCFKPVYCSSKHTYSIRANNANYRKREKFIKNEAVKLVDNRELLIPSSEYCEKWNEKRKKDLNEREKVQEDIIANIPRKYAENYNVDFVGTKYESIEVLECINDRLESEPKFSYTQQHRKKYQDIIVYKQYRCKCYLCNKEIITTCDMFGIYPPTEYGITAYDGYWSKLKCECHKISSFQWIVNKILLDLKIPYEVEKTFPGLYGHYGKKLLSFDFAIYNFDGSLKCLIECQGEQHYKPIEEFGGELKYKDQLENDRLKKYYAEKHGIKLIEISYKDKKYEKVKAFILDEVIEK